MMMLLLVLAALAFGAAIFIASETVVPAARRRHTAVATVRRWSIGNGRAAPVPRFSSTAFNRGVETAGRKLTTDRLRKSLPDRIAAAGFSGRVTVESFAAGRAGLTAVGVLGGLCFATLAGLSAGVVILAMIAFGLAGYLLPGVLLDQRARVRREAISSSLPDALDLLAVTVEAGLGLFGAIQKLVETSEGALADEFALVLTELRVGDSSERALTRMAKRVGSPEVSSFVRSLLQGEQLGISLARTLRNLAEDTRNRRRAIAEEKAAKAPVKMLFPAALFIFPALFIVILGPAVLELRNYL